MSVRRSSLTLLVACISVIIVISAGVIILQTWLDPFTSGVTTGTSATGPALSNSQSAATTKTLSKSSLVTNSRPVVTVFSTVIKSVQQTKYTTIFESTTVNGTATVLNRTVTVIENITQPSTSFYTVTVTSTSVVNITTTASKTGTATKTS